VDSRPSLPRPTLGLKLGPKRHVKKKHTHLTHSLSHAPFVAGTQVRHHSTPQEVGKNTGLQISVAALHASFEEVVCVYSESA